jgi:hypothetical protein
MNFQRFNVDYKPDWLPGRLIYGYRPAVRLSYHLVYSLGIIVSVVNTRDSWHAVHVMWSKDNEFYEPMPDNPVDVLKDVAA